MKPSFESRIIYVSSRGMGLPKEGERFHHYEATSEGKNSRGIMKHLARGRDAALMMVMSRGEFVLRKRQALSGQAKLESKWLF